MTHAEQSLADDKMRAEIANLIAATSKLNAETSKITRERFWIPFTVFAGVIVAIVSIVPRLIQ
ncbi:hypothetical protein [Falsirhodobacter halotolerans]|uniref:hypothetical protein n=1 Tax=Falsirhodobacter halotolerans TaxID=1146892 RepID=UPI001FD041DE|nr:hypothetical protein [Falsirhodobacter halotolerans]MCJ8139336.1 hypothetical protein [Falsirhodobacter halotolerans]